MATDSDDADLVEPEAPEDDMTYGEEAAIIEIYHEEQGDA